MPSSMGEVGDKTG